MRLIDADALLEGINDSWMYKNVARHILKSAPTVDAEPVRHGKRGQHLGNLYYCSVCGRLAYCENYCSNCGAKMDGEGAEQ